MDKNILWSLRLGFSSKESKSIQKYGLAEFLEKSYKASFDTSLPELLQDSPKSLAELKEMKEAVKDSNKSKAKEIIKREAKNNQELKAWWLDKIAMSPFPLREKMVCFWHNHYVSTYQKVKVNYWIYQHNQCLREHAFGNFKTLTKKIVQTNAMIRYLDNVDNKKNDLNENLSRELLELFTLGIGNYSESDIKNGAKGLAGLNYGEDHAEYRPRQVNNEVMTYFGQIGQFKIEEMIDIIFEQKAIPYLITRKLLKWFIYDNPSEELVTYYGDYFRKVDFEIKPLLTKICTEEYKKETAGSKIKDPLTYTLQLMHELNIETKNWKPTIFFLKTQGMDLFNQPNVKGWNGGREWLTSQILLQRNNVADLLCNGKGFSRKIQFQDGEMNENVNQTINVNLDWNKKGTNLDIIAELSNKLLFQTDDEMQKDWEQLLKYDFDPNLEGANNAVLRLFNNMIKTPEFQLI